MRLAALLAAAVLAGCGGGGGDVPAPVPAPTPDPNAARVAAATATATSSANACAAAQPFYWEIGNAAGKLASASVASAERSDGLHGRRRR